MTLSIPFDNSYAALPDVFFTRQRPAPVAEPELIVFNHALAAEMGIDGTDDPRLAGVFAGNEIPEGAAPLAQLYAGHQFGQFNPQLGDGRALLLGETVGRDGRRRDIQLKGSGPTPYSRNGDGRAWLGPVLREYLVSEAMFALGVSTTRALAAVRTGEPVYREAALPGAVLTRVAASHIRVGTFQVFAARQDLKALRDLLDHAIARHYPDADGPRGLLQSVIRAQAALVAHWMSFGFIHGVMNTDNCAISGETIDYGPCAFMDAYNPDTVFSSIDRRGRYAYANQADIIIWNMAQLATSLVPLMPDTDEAVKGFTADVQAMAAMIRQEWLSRFAAKIGIANARSEDAALIGALLTAMDENQADFTNTFRDLSGGDARDQFTDPAAFDLWAEGWKRRLDDENDPEATMKAANPAFIPRNHRVEQMIAAAAAGDDAPFHRMLDVLSRPYTDQSGAEDLTRPPLPSEVVPATFCGT